MAELTKEAFEQVLDGKLNKVRDELTAHIDASTIGVRNDISGLRAEMNLRFDAMLEILDVRNRVETLEKQVAALQSR